MRTESDTGNEKLLRTASTDRRIRKTTSALKHSLTLLLQSKKLKDISVKELTEHADVNRGTFYLHYRDVFDLLEQSEEELLQELRHMVNSYPVETVEKNPEVLFRGLYEICRKNADLVRILIGENGDIKFLNNLQVLLREKCLHDWSSLLRQQRLSHFDAYFAFVSGGCLSLLQYWFRDGMRESPEELAEITGIFLERNL